MDRGLEIKDTTFLSPSLQPYSLFQPPPPPPPPPPPLSSSQSSGFNLNNRVSPSILIIIIILAVIFFISGLLHLLVRFLLRPPNRNPDEIDNLTALQGQLQQLFHLHDSGVDQSFIDTLPLFNYKAIIGVKDPFDCAVCLCEFEREDKLRLLPNCSHAFHMDCIDTWLLSHSTCPLCRASLVAAFSQNSHCSPVVMVLESGSESSQEIGSDREAESGGGNSVGRVNSHLSTHYGDDDSALSCGDPVLKCGETEVRERENSGEKVMSVKLGKCRNVGGGDEGSSEINAEARRCFSMGSFAYVMDEHSSLKVFITTPMKKQSSKKPSLPLRPGHRVAMSECGCDSRREFNGIEAFKILGTDQSGGNDNKSIVGSKRDSFSVSKIWLRGRKDKPNAARMESSRRAVSFRFPMHRNPVAAGELDTKNGGSGGDPGTRSEIEISRLENGGRELDFEEEMEVQRCNSLDCEGDHSSFGRRTLLWLTGRQNKVVRSSFSSNV